MVLAVACLSGPAVAADAPFRVDPGSAALRERPELRERLIASPHGYLRFLSVPFAEEVCRRFRDLKDLPEASLHGDAHVEQYAVTSLGRGLTDFDDSARGPSVLDLVRFGVSLQLAARQRGWPEEGRKSLEAFLRGYRERLGGHSVIPTPIVVTRLRSTFKLDHHDLLRRAETYIDAAPIPLEQAEEAFHQYAVHALKEWPGIPETFFKLKKMGILRMGIGSALDEKFLIRVEGWTRGDDDDVVLEAKLVREQSGISCLRQGVGAIRVMNGNALIAYEPFPFSGLFTSSDGKTFWVHAWPDDYQELSIATSFESPRELREVAFDVGIQLGRAHPKAMNVPTERKDQVALRDCAQRYEGRIRVAVDEMTEEIVTAWREFRQAAGVGARP
jgi:hypothetical protein